jgi:hypothetical protein
MPARTAGAGIGIHTPVKGRNLTPDTVTRTPNAM